MKFYTVVGCNLGSDCKENTKFQIQLTNRRAITNCYRKRDGP